MAKFECTIPAGYDFDETLQFFHNHLSTSGISASFEDGSNYQSGNFRLAVRVYERYTIMGGNRLSMTLTLATSGNEIFLSAITAGGSQGIVKFINWGEDEFLSYFVRAAEQFEGMTPVKTFHPFYSTQ